MTSLQSPSSLRPQVEAQRDDDASATVASSSSRDLFRGRTERDLATSSSQRMSIESLHFAGPFPLHFPDVSFLASRLRRLDDLLDALRELHQLLQTATEKDISAHGTEIISLVEVAQSTLTKAKIHLWRYSPCPAHFQPHKRLYFLVLKELKTRKFCFDISLRRRWGVLVFHLSEDFKWGGSYRDFYTTTLATPKESLGQSRNPSGNVSTALRDSHLTQSMPPPSAFPSSEGISSLSLLPPRRKAKPLDLMEYFPDLAFSLQARRPMKQRFGIFCTSKTSMFRPSHTSAHRGKEFVEMASRHSLISD
ncbi:hypothetical protein L218DRAFT_1081478 [Marasmius fiardii PR-910]|nr:hypothetical protein L218DRAFT_1081478 [Marasmius fiardii PR-910]